MDTFDAIMFLNFLKIPNFFINTAQKWSFPLRISSVNVTKSAVTDLVGFTEEIFNAKLHLLCSVYTTEHTKSLK